MPKRSGNKPIRKFFRPKRRRHERLRNQQALKNCKEDRNEPAHEVSSYKDDVMADHPYYKNNFTMHAPKYNNSESICINEKSTLINEDIIVGSPSLEDDFMADHTGTNNEEISDINESTHSSVSHMGDVLIIPDFQSNDIPEPAETGGMQSTIVTEEIFDWKCKVETCSSTSSAEDLRDTGIPMSVLPDPLVLTAQEMSGSSFISEDRLIETIKTSCENETGSSHIIQLIPVMEEFTLPVLTADRPALHHHPSSLTPLKELLVAVHSKVSLRCPVNWVMIVNDAGLQSGLLATQYTFLIQRSLCVSPLGDVTVQVHGKNLPECHQICSRMEEIPKIALTDESVESFTDNFLKLLDILRSYEVCKGVEILEDLWQNCDGAFIDYNPFQERRYSRTLRSCDCLILVNSLRFERCAKCKSLYKCISEKKRRKDKHPTCILPAKKATKDERPSYPEKEKEIKNDARKHRNLQKL